ncbi:MAG: urea transporter [Rubrobacter sp.]|nr:urea transporter [Rubrobacter sp.]
MDVNSAHRSVSLLRSLDGVMPQWSERLESRPALDFVHYCLRGVGQIVFMNNPVTGLLILVGMWVFSPWLGFAAVLGVVASTASALILGLDRVAVRAGLYGFNGALVGAGLATFLEPPWSGRELVYIVVVAAFSTMLMATLGAMLLPRLKVPPLTLPFNFATLAFLLAAFAVAHGDVGPLVGPQSPTVVGPEIDTSLRAAEGGSAVGVVEGVVNAIVRGISQLFLADSVVASLIILAGMFVCSRIATAFAVLGSALGVATGLLLGADGYKVYHGFWGYNSYVSAVAIGGVFFVLTWRSALFAAACAVVTALLFATISTVFSPWGLPALTLPFCFGTLAFLIMKELTPRFQEVPIEEVTTPEEHRRLLGRGEAEFGGRDAVGEQRE